MRVFSLRWVVTEELESCVCSSKRGAGLYIGGRDPKEKGESQQHVGMRQTDMCEMIPPMNEGESSSRVCPPPLLLRPTIRPSVRPTDRQTHKPTETHTSKRSLFFCPADAEKRNQESKVRTRIQFSLFPSFFPPPIISQRETQTQKLQLRRRTPAM